MTIGNNSTIGQKVSIHSKKLSGAMLIPVACSQQMVLNLDVAVASFYWSEGLEASQQVCKPPVWQGRETPGQAHQPTFIINPLECDGLLLGNAAHGPHLLTQLPKGQSGCQVRDQHVPGWDAHGPHVKTEPLCGEEPDQRGPFTSSTTINAATRF